MPLSAPDLCEPIANAKKLMNERTGVVESCDDVSDHQSQRPLEHKHTLLGGWFWQQILVWNLPNMVRQQPVDGVLDAGEPGGSAGIRRVEVIDAQS
jgi:hypothetical protein